MRIFLRLFWWLQNIMFLWVRSKVYPKKLKEDLRLDPKKPICYLLKSRSFTDLLLLDHYCRKENLPRPIANIRDITGTSLAACIYLQKSGIFQKSRSKKPPNSLLQIISDVKSQKSDVQIVPVSIFWGRNPGKEEKSLLKLLFFDDENGGLLQRFFTFFVQGQNVFCNFGKPISTLELINENSNIDDSAKKLRLVLKIHFRRQRETIVGPFIYDRNQVIKSIIASKPVQQALLAEAKKTKLSSRKIEDKAKKYADEVCAKVSYHTIRFFDIILSWFCRKIYDDLDVRNGDRIRELAEQYELVYMPSHRSHMDYLLIGYILHYIGLLPPHTIAGSNLNFWPVGPLLKRGGGIFIRRSFGGDRLYAAVVNQFMQHLLATGFPICFYPEGGRSRTGFLLPPKIGILSMIIEGLKFNTKKPILLVPIYVGYDKVLESSSYQKEIFGKSKKRESF